MPVLLHRSDDIPTLPWRHWCAVGGVTRPEWSADRQLPGLALALEQAFDACHEQWRQQADIHRGDRDSQLSHTLALAANLADHGVMLAWTRLVSAWAQSADTIVVFCDDPWLFRHMATLTGVRPGHPPRLPGWKPGLRGLASRLKVSLTMARAALRLRTQARQAGTGEKWLLVYGHPASTADGDDAYFGPLMRQAPGLRRLLHVDCPPARALQLAADGRSLSLHGFGSPWFALGLWRRRWRVGAKSDWLIRRAAAREAATGSPAMIAWQIHCQQEWVRRAKPATVIWPWENHAWERALVQECRSRGVVSIGYQHATVAWREWNYGAHGPTPDRILCSGPAGRDRLLALGHQDDHLSIAGAWRFTQQSMPRHDPTAPVFVALPFDHVIAAELLDAIKPLAAKGAGFVIRDHPMSPCVFAEAPGLRRAKTGLEGQDAVSAVLYCLTSVGLQAAIAGLPTLRFVPRSRPVADVLPQGVHVMAADSLDLADGLNRVQATTPMERRHVFADPNMALWNEVVG